MVFFKTQFTSIDVLFHPLFIMLLTAALRIVPSYYSPLAVSALMSYNYPPTLWCTGSKTLGNVASCAAVFWWVELGREWHEQG